MKRREFITLLGENAAVSTKTQMGGFSYAWH